MRHCDPHGCACNGDQNQSPRIDAGHRRGKSLGHHRPTTAALNGGAAMASPLNRPGVQSRGRVAAFSTSKVGGPPVDGGPWRPNPGAHTLHLRVAPGVQTRGPLSILHYANDLFWAKRKICAGGRSPGRAHGGHAIVAARCRSMRALRTAGSSAMPAAYAAGGTTSPLLARRGQTARTADRHSPSRSPLPAAAWLGGTSESHRLGRAGLPRGPRRQPADEVLGDNQTTEADVMELLGFEGHALA